MSRQRISQHYSRIFGRWPIDRIRPEERSFRHVVLHKRIESAVPDAHDENHAVNAAYLLLDNAFSRRFPISQRIMKPASNPNHYLDLEKELDEAPDRTWFGNLMKRMRGMIKFQ